MRKEPQIARQDGKCAYCRRDVFLHDDDLASMATWDEIVPLSRGGRKSRSNRVIACYHCNRRKANLDVRVFLPGWKPEPHWMTND